MGLETGLGVGLLVTEIGLQVGSMVSGVSSANKQVKALKEEEELKTGERAKETNALAASQKVAFLNSGIAFTGEDNSTPMSLLSDTYNKGRQDISQISKNYKTRINNVYSQSRSDFLQGLANLAFTGLSSLGGLDGGLDGGSAIQGGVGGMDTGMQSLLGINGGEPFPTWSPFNEFGERII